MKTKKKSHKANAYQRKQERYIQKKKQQNKKVDLIPRKLSASQLADYKEKFAPLVELANDNITKIKEAGYNSLAVDRIERQVGREYFDISSAKTRGELMAEITAVRVFLADKGSTLNGAKLETIETNSAIYKGKFGNQYNKEEYNFARYDITTIDEDAAKRAFENYRKIEEIRASQIGTQKLAIETESVYGSENLIIAMYDFEINKDEKYSYFKGDSFDFANDILNTFIQQTDTAWKPIENEAEETMAISGVYYDNLKRGLNF